MATEALMSETIDPRGHTTVAVRHRGRLFAGSCCGAGISGLRFAVLGAIMYTLKERFLLTNEQVGSISGAGLWGCAAAMLCCGSLCDAVGMKRFVYTAFLAHVGGTLLMIVAKNFTMLYAGALTISVGDGLLQSAIYPLVATIYPDRKTEMFNKLLLWFPGGMVLGGLIIFAIGSPAASHFAQTYLPGVGLWQWELALLFVPAVAYGLLFLGQTFPATERVQAGISYGQMFRETFARPLYWLLLACMMMTASVELGPNAWVTAVLEAKELPGILIFVWISLLAAVMRYFAGALGRRVRPTAVLLGSAVLSGGGLLWLSAADTLAAVMAASAIFSVGVCSFWPTMLGVTADRVPKGGALALTLMSSAGMFFVGYATLPEMGRLADSYAQGQLPTVATIAVLQQTVARYGGPAPQQSDWLPQDAAEAVKAAEAVLAFYAASGELPRYETAAALRRTKAVEQQLPLAKQVDAVLKPAENYGGRVSFRWVALLSAALTVIFAALYLDDRVRGRRAE
jgi:MFS family permease